MRRLLIGIACVVAMATTLPAASIFADTSEAACIDLQAQLSDDKNYYVFTATASGRADAITAYRFDFGDHQSYRAGIATGADRTTASAIHRYSQPGTYTVTASVQTTSRTATTPSDTSCRVQVTIGSAPASALPDTGATGALGAAGLAAIAGGLAHTIYLRYRRRRTAPL